MAKINFPDSPADNEIFDDFIYNDTSGVWDLDTIPRSTAFTSVGTILQVVSVTKTDTFSSGSIGAGAVTGEISGFTATITPSSASSKVLVSCSVSVSNSDDNRSTNAILFRGNSALAAATGNVDGVRVRVTSGGSPGEKVIHSLSVGFLDSPATTSATTYGIRLHNGSEAAETVFLNRSATNTDSTRFARSISTITLMEVAG